MKILLIFGASGSIGSSLFKYSKNFYDKVIPIDKKIENQKSTNNEFIFLDLNKFDLKNDLLSQFSFHKEDQISIIFAQRPFINLKPKSMTENIGTALQISILSSLKIIEEIEPLFKLKNVSFLGSINSFQVCDQPLSYMISKSACDTAVKFLALKYPSTIFLNFIIGLVNDDSKKNNFSSNSFKRQCGEASLGGQKVPNVNDISKSILKLMNLDMTLSSGNNIYLDRGQSHIDSFFSARINQIK